VNAVSTAERAVAQRLRTLLPPPLVVFLSRLRPWILFPLTVAALVTTVSEFLIQTKVDLAARLRLLVRFARIHITPGLKVGHKFGDLLHIARVMVDLAQDRSRRGVVVECGCWEGASSAKLSVVAEEVGWRVIVFDSFRGLPAPGPTDERLFTPGAYASPLARVSANVERLGAAGCVTFVPGWFDETLPRFQAQGLDVVFIDVDLEQSIRTCIEHLYPRLSPGGYFFTHEAHLPTTVKVFTDRTFWLERCGTEPPRFVGAGTGLGLGKEWLGYVRR